MDGPRITPQPDGSLRVEGGAALTDDAGFPIETGERAFLCRCGHSANKPFCDGSHKRAGFSSETGAEQPRNRVIAYEAKLDGRAVTVTYNPMLCSHAAECQRLHQAVFDPGQKPWIQPGKGTLPGLRAVVYACPSGALRLAEAGGQEPEQLGPDPATAEIRVRRNGPYEVRNVALDAAFYGAGASERKYVLCRCGHSGNKPFCDGSHRDAGWTDGDDT